jgi:hypothetical protein
MHRLPENAFHQIEEFHGHRCRVAGSLSAVTDRSAPLRLVLLTES